MNTCPPDIAKLTFYQFVKSPMGVDFAVMCHLNGQPNPGEWDNYNRWWLLQRQQLDDKLGRRGDAPDWPMFVAWRSKLFMSIFMDIQKHMTTNLTAVSLEKLIWDLTALRNILLELQLVYLEDLKKPSTYFQKVAVMGKLRKIIFLKNIRFSTTKSIIKSLFFLFLFIYYLGKKLLTCDGKFESIKTVITELLPKSYGSWWFLNVAQQDFKLAFNGHQLKTFVDCDNMAIPRFKSLPEKYR